MLVGIGFKVILVSTLVLAVLVPTRARILGGRWQSGETRDGVFARHPVVGLIPPLAGLLDLIIDQPNTSSASASASDRRLANLAASLVFATALSAFALIPFGSRYRFGEREISLVVANLDWGIIWLLCAGMLALFCGVALVRQASRRVPLAIVGVSYALGAGLALAAVAMVYGSQNPTAIVVAQDQNFSLADFVGPALPALQRLTLPAWGLFLQPVSLLLFAYCALGVSRAPRFDVEAYRSGTERLLLRGADHLAGLLVASVVVVLFLGGGALPYVSGDAIILVIGNYYGVGLATILCMVIHLTVFIGKMMLITIAIEPLRGRLSRLSFEVALTRCWKVIIPLAFLNLFVTAQVLLAGGTS